MEICEINAGQPTNFFARRVRGFTPLEFTADVESVERMVSAMTRSEIVEKYSTMSSKAVKIEVAGPSKFIVRSDDIYRAVKKGFIAPSMYVSYRICARSLAIELMSVREIGGVEVSVDDLRSFVKGMLVHSIYYRKYAQGRTEVPVESDKHRVVGVVDELREGVNGISVIEVKSSWKPDIVGASLQVMSYMLAVSTSYNVRLDDVKGFIVYPSGCYMVYLDLNILEEYSRRLSKIVEIAMSGDKSSLPPRLPRELESRCGTCPHRGRCKVLPDNYRTYERYFRAMGFTKIYERKHPTLLDYRRTTPEESGKEL